MLNGIDLSYFFQWWLVLFLLGIIALPYTNILFKTFPDKGYIFSKVLSLAFLSYIPFLLSSIHIVSFSTQSILGVFIAIGIGGLFLLRKTRAVQKQSTLQGAPWALFSEVLFAGSLYIWSSVRAHEPSIHGLEKFMDFGFLNSILRTDYFPARDMWYTPLGINYYYFGHIVTGVLTKIANIDSSVTYNLMIATLFAFTITCTFSLASALLSTFCKKNVALIVVGALLAAYLVALSGNLHTIYGFFTPYDADHPVPFWQLPLNKTDTGQLDPFSKYWYPNATRFIPFTIHEFPSYSFIVSDLHGHVLDIPFVILFMSLCLALVLELFDKREKLTYKLFLKQPFIYTMPLLGFLIGVMYMTNAWDAGIYLVFSALCVLLLLFRKTQSFSKAVGYTVLFGVVVSGIFLLTSLPFMINFKSIVTSVGVMCMPQSLTDKGHIGPLLFEANHCSPSPLYMLGILWGFFYFFVLLFLFWKVYFTKKNDSELPSDLFLFVVIVVATLLLLFPEIAYLKDIYPAHYRANTMFKLGYQAFIMLSIASSVILFRFTLWLKTALKGMQKLFLIPFAFIVLCMLFLVGIYPYFGIMSYYGNLKTYHGLDGLAYLQTDNKDDYDAIQWLRTHISGQPVVLEAVGDSYTDYARISANTGLPTVVGWPVHEWLWRGSYDVAAPRIADVQTLYETKDENQAKQLLQQYKVAYVVVGNLEREKYPNLVVSKFEILGKPVYANTSDIIYQVNR